MSQRQVTNAEHYTAAVQKELAHASALLSHLLNLVHGYELDPSYKKIVRALLLRNATILHRTQNLRQQMGCSQNNHEAERTRWIREEYVYYEGTKTPKEAFASILKEISTFLTELQAHYSGVSEGTSKFDKKTGDLYTTMNTYIEFIMQHIATFN